MGTRDRGSVDRKIQNLSGYRTEESGCSMCGCGIGRLHIEDGMVVSIECAGKSLAGV